MLRVGSTEADSEIGAIDGAMKGVSGDAFGYDISRRTELVSWGKHYRHVVSAAAKNEFTGGLSESAASADAEPTAAALGFWIENELRS